MGTDRTTRTHRPNHLASMAKCNNATLNIYTKKEADKHYTASKVLMPTTINNCNAYSDGHQLLKK